MVYNIIIEPDAEKDLDKMDNGIRKLFFKHFEKLVQTFYLGKHLCHGLPYFVEKVTESARFPFYIRNNIIYVFRCFKTHKEYEDWYRSV